jgi:hypothetical protein
VTRFGPIFVLSLCEMFQGTRGHAGNVSALTFQNVLALMLPA